MLHGKSFSVVRSSRVRFWAKCNFFLLLLVGRENVKVSQQLFFLPVSQSLADASSSLRSLSFVLKTREEGEFVCMQILTICRAIFGRDSMRWLMFPDGGMFIVHSRGDVCLGQGIEWRSSCSALSRTSSQWCSKSLSFHVAEHDGCEKFIYVLCWRTERADICKTFSGKWIIRVQTWLISFRARRVELLD